MKGAFSILGDRVWSGDGDKGRSRGRFTVRGKPERDGRARGRTTDMVR